MDGPGDYKWSKSEKERQIPCDIIYMWNIKYGQMNLPTKQTHKENRLVGAKGKGDELWGWARYMPTITFRMDK